MAKIQMKTRVTNTAVRNINNVVFYVETLQYQDQKTHVWLPSGYQIRVKHYNQNKPFPYDHIPTNEELMKLWRWR